MEVDEHEKYDDGFTYSNSIYIQHGLNMWQLAGVISKEWNNENPNISTVRHVICVTIMAKKKIILNMNTEFFATQTEPTCQKVLNF